MCVICISGHFFKATKGCLRIKKCHKKWKKSKRWGRGQPRKSKRPQFRMWTFWQEGGHIFIFFLNVNADFKCFSWTKNNWSLKWFLGNFKCFKLKFHVLRGGPENSKFSQFEIFPKLGTGGGSSYFKFFPTSKKSKSS